MMQRWMARGVTAVVTAVVMTAVTVVVTTGLAASSAHAQVVLTAAEVVKVDKAAGRVTLKQAEVKNLGMPAMTMAWRVRESRWLDELAVGDRVRFAAERVDGQFTIVSLSKAP
jgi:Cu/Ag efflux protein CusF